MTLRKTGVTGMAGLVMVVAGALAGCASSSSTSSATTPNAAASSPSSTAPASSPATAASSPAATPAAAGPAACATSDLKATTGVAQGAAGSVYQSIDFTNIGTTTCTMYGYPGVALATGTAPSTQIGAAATRSTPPGPSVVTLKPGGVANAVLRVVQAENYPTATCGPVASAYLQIYPPGQTAAIYLAYKSTGCSASGVKVLTIGVVQAGAGSGS